MGKGSRKIYWAGAGAAVLLVGLIAAAVIAPRIVSSDWLREIIHTEVTKQIDGDFDFRKAKLVILPVPAISLLDVSLAIPETAKIELATIKVYPKLLPILVGNIKLDKISIDNPDFSLPLPKKSGDKADQAKPVKLSDILATTSTKLSQILSAIPNLDISIKNGSLRLFAGGKEVFLFEQLNGSIEFSTPKITASVNCESNIWDSMKLQIKLNPVAQNGKGKIQLKKVTSKVLVDYFFPEKANIIDGSIAALQLNFSVNPETGLQVDTLSSETIFNTRYKDKKYTLKINNLKGNLQHDDNRNLITVDDLTFSYPSINLSGSLAHDKTVPHASLEIKSENADITNLYVVLSAFINTFFGDMPVIDEIFNIKRGGTLTKASFRSEGKSLADLAVFQTMHMQGHVKDGKVVLADFGLNLNDVAGDIVIKDGILKGNNLQAQQGNTKASEGSLELGLVKKETTPFHLDLKLNVDVPDLPPVLKQLLKGNDNFQKHLSLFQSLEGKANCRLTLGDSLESIKVRAEVNPINIQAQYKLIPYPVSIDSGRILFEGLKIQSQQLQGKIGSSTFTDYTDRISWEDEPFVDIQSGNFHVVMDEIFPWLASESRLKDVLRDIEKITGIAEVSVKSVKGPLLKPDDIQYDIQGDLKNVALQTTALPDSLGIKSGKIHVQKDKIIFEDLQAALLDSSITYSAVLQDFISGTVNANLIVTDAFVGPELNTWFAQEISVPDEYILRTPLLISRATLQWTMKELIDLQGDFYIKDGPIFYIDVMLNPDELILRDFSLKNDDEEADIKLELKKREITAEFDGSLSKKTIDEILIYKNIDHNAWIKGDIRFYINMDSFLESTASGNLEGGDFFFPMKLDNPILLKGFSLAAAGKTVTINSADFLFDEKNYSLSGSASLKQEHISAELDVKADLIELDKILTTIQTIDKEEDEELEEVKRVGKTWDLTVDGSVDIHAKSLLYNRYTWEPFKSTISYKDKSLDIDIHEAELCKISTPGSIVFHNGEIAFDLQVEVAGQEFKEIMACFEGDKQQITGIVNLEANVAGQGKKGSLVNSLQGDLKISAKEGFIYQDARAAKLLTFLNVTKMFKGKIPDLKTDGFDYDSILIEGDMENGILAIDTAKLEAPIMEIVSQGTVNIPEQRLNFLVLVAPLQTVNWLRSNLPIIRTILPTSLAAVPVEVTGDFSDIQVKAMSMSAMGSNAFGVMTDVLSTPVRVLEGR